MWTAEAVLVCALTLLGRSESSFPPIHFLNVAPADVSADAEAFTRVNGRHLYLVTSSRLFQRLQRDANRCGDLAAVRKLASVLVHEEAHVVRGANEREAYAAQLTTLASLGAGPGSALYTEVSRSMRYTSARGRAEPVRIMVVR